MKHRRLWREEAPRSDGLDVGALAPMVDMMTLLLVFLLRSYASDPAPAPPDGPFRLAGTLSEDPRTAAVVVLLSTEAVWVQGRRVAALAYLPEGELVREVYDPLLAQREKRRVEIHADGAVPYAVLERVLYTARAAGFDELVLVGASRASL